MYNGKEVKWGSPDGPVSEQLRSDIRKRIMKLRPIIDTFSSFDLAVDADQAVAVLTHLYDFSYDPAFSLKKWASEGHVRVGKVLYARPIDFILAMEELVDPAFAPQPPRGSKPREVTDEEPIAPATPIVHLSALKKPLALITDQRLMHKAPTHEQERILNLKRDLSAIGVLDVRLDDNSASYQIIAFELLKKVFQELAQYMKHDEEKEVRENPRMKPFFANRKIFVKHSSDMLQAIKGWEISGNIVTLYVSPTFGRPYVSTSSGHDTMVFEKQLIKKAVDLQELIEKKNRFYHTVRILQSNYGLNLEALKQMTQKPQFHDWEYLVRVLPVLAASLHAYDAEFKKDGDSLKECMQGYAVTLTNQSLTGTRMKSATQDGLFSLGTNLESARLHIQIFLEGLLQSRGIERDVRNKH